MWTWPSNLSGIGRAPRYGQIFQNERETIQDNLYIESARLKVNKAKVDKNFLGTKLKVTDFSKTLSALKVRFRSETNQIIVHNFARSIDKTNRISTWWEGIIIEHIEPNAQKRSKLIQNFAGQTKKLTNILTPACRIEKRMDSILNCEISTLLKWAGKDDQDS